MERDTVTLTYLTHDAVTLTHHPITRKKISFVRKEISFVRKSPNNSSPNQAMLRLIQLDSESASQCVAVCCNSESASAANQLRLILRYDVVHTLIYKHTYKHTYKHI